MATLPRLCNHPGCNGTTVPASFYCAAHKQAAAARQARRTQEHDARRGSASSRGYDVKWRRNRAMFLRRNPVCSAPGCMKPATDVDHVIPKARGGSDRWDNLQALCHPCHSRKTIAEFRGEGGRVAPREEVVRASGRGGRITTAEGDGTAVGGQIFTPSGFGGGGVSRPGGADGR